MIPPAKFAAVIAAAMFGHQRSGYPWFKGRSIPTYACISGPRSSAAIMRASAAACYSGLRCLAFGRSA